MWSLLHQAWARVRGHLRSEALDQDLLEELESHLVMAEEEKVAQGLSPGEARREARIELGGLTQLRLAGREARGLPWLDTFWLDLKLGLRWLRRSWGLTLVGGLAMALAILVAVAIFTFVHWGTGIDLPLEEGERVVAIQVWEHRAQLQEGTPYADFERWREGLQSLEELGAFQTAERNFRPGHGVSAGDVEPVEVAEMSASGFRLARVEPLFGRTLIEADEAPGSAPVVVLGHGLWKSRFGADPAVLERRIQLGDQVHSVVGVMPEGFSFPLSHGLWVPLRQAATELLPMPPSGVVFGRLAPGATLDSAQAELRSLGLLPTAEPEEVVQHQLLVVPYAAAFLSDDPAQARRLLRLAQILLVLLLVPPCANIAILVYARTITRQQEFAARHALGAGRGRIVGQLFVEMLVLAAGAAVLAVLTLRLAIGWAVTHLITHSTGGVPFWVELRLPMEAIFFAAGLAVVAALVAGLLPALKATKGEMRSGLQALGGRSGLRLGRTWTALVVAQVALTLGALPAAVELGWGTVRKGVLGPGFQAGEYLTARLSVDWSGIREGASLEAELVRRLSAEPGVLGVTLGDLPGDEPWKVIEIEAAVQEKGATEGAATGPVIAGESPRRRLVRVAEVDEAFLDVYDIQLLTGRRFQGGDFTREGRAVLVNQTFVDKQLGGASPLGQRLRLALDAESIASGARPLPWSEIVGVVGDRPANAVRGTVYQARDRGELQATGLALRLRSDPSALAPRLRELAAAVDSNLKVKEILTLDEVYRDQAVGNNVGALTLGTALLSVLLLSAAGMYALLSFTVNQRRREIGIRSALGASPGRLVASVFKRALVQLAAGAAIGLAVALLLGHLLPAELLGGWEIPGVIPSAAVLMLGVALIAITGPARRGLRVDPIEELRQG